MAKSVLLLVVGVGVVLMWTPAHPAGPAGTYWWENPQVVETLTLTPEQSRKIHEVVHRSLEKRKDRRKQISKLRRFMARLLSAPELDEEQVFRTFATISELGNNQRRDVLNMRIQVRHVLSAEQFHKLLALRPSVMRQRWIPRRAGLTGNQTPAAAKTD